MRDVTRQTAHHYGEHALLHLAGVLGAEDDHLHALEVDLDRGGGGHSGRETVGGELAGVVDDKVGLAKVGEFFLSRTDEHVVHEQGMVSSCANDTDFDAVFRIPLKDRVSVEQDEINV